VMIESRNSRPSTRWRYFISPNYVTVGVWNGPPTV
jgi:hypothetical protein